MNCLECSEERRRLLFNVGRVVSRRVSQQPPVMLSSVSSAQLNSPPSSASRNALENLTACSYAVANPSLPP
jgi:hypothetical protein